MVIAGFTASLGLLPTPASAAPLVVKADHVTPGPGWIRFALYRGAKGFRHEKQAIKVIQVRATAASVTARFDDLPPGQYAVIAYHDANEDQKLGLRFGMFPTEGWGLSNNPRVMGPPSFSASSFTVNEQGGSISINLRY
ncbi:DUF2141 domain-containing protein [Sphingobium sp. H39-3-25]|uniref:DUF2141 domain-containing protein n=1 Tax=Sphingobium arseniciresistens TaxID=3030834 RepID=UPI0023B9FBF9|nr:DUF2141 domain-containing protein [Sphingobium arseniciresistens]